MRNCIISINFTGPRIKKILYANTRYGDPNWNIKYNPGLLRFSLCPEKDCYVTTKEEEYMEGEKNSILKIILAYTWNQITRRQYYE